jgi:hypothetical protein
MPVSASLKSFAEADCEESRRGVSTVSPALSHETAPLCGVPLRRAELRADLGGGREVQITPTTNLAGFARAVRQP